MNKLNIEVSSSGIHPETIIIDGGGMLHHLYWPLNGTVNDFLKIAKKHFVKKLQESYVNLVLVRYDENSLKLDTRDARHGAFHWSDQLTSDVTVSCHLRKSAQNHP